VTRPSTGLDYSSLFLVRRDPEESGCDTVRLRKPHRGRSTDWVTHGPSLEGADDLAERRRVEEITEIVLYSESVLNGRSELNS
jgi:hypothetical protein